MIQRGAEVDTDAPAGHQLAGSADVRRAALDRWQRGAGPYWLYVCAAPFLRELPAPPRSRRESRLGRAVHGAIARLGAGRRRAVFVDLPPTRTLPIGPRLVELGYRVVPVIQRWITAPAVVPCAELAWQLVTVDAGAPGPDRPPGVVFLLDGDRLGPQRRVPHPAREPAIRRVFDNRYEYSADRFPAATFLLDDGVEATCWVVRDEIAPDLQPYATRLAEDGLASEIIRVGWP